MIYEYSKSIFTGQTLEVYQFERRPKVATSRKRVVREPGSRGYDPLAKRRTDNIRRLRRGFLRLVQTNTSAKGSPALATFTFASDVDFDTALRCFNEFTKTLRKEIDPGISYIGVPEFQKSGRPHFHVLLWGLDIKYVHGERNARYLQAIWAYGYVDLIPTDGSPKLAGYVAKYMQKAVFDDRLLGRRSYYCSRNALRPMLFKTSAIVHYTKEILGVDIELLTEKEYSTEWLGAGRYQVYRVIDQDHAN